MRRISVAALLAVLVALVVAVISLAVGSPRPTDAADVGEEATESKSGVQSLTKAARAQAAPGEPTPLPSRGVVVEDVTGGVIVGARGTCEGGGALLESDGEGRIAIPSDCRAIELVAAGYVSRRVDAPLDETIRLTPAGSISGVVATREGRGVAGATVAGGNDLQTVTGPDGRFELGGLAPGRYQLEAWAMKPSALHGRADRSIRLDLAERRDGVEVVLIPSNMVRVRVEDTLGDPCERTQVWLRSEAANESRLVDGDSVTFAGLESGSYELEARCWQSGSGPEGRGTFHEAISLGGGSSEYEVRVLAGSSVRGRVLADGDPVAGARVVVLGGDDEQPEVRSAETDEAGHYMVFGLEAGTFTVGVAGSPEESVQLEVSGPTSLDWELPARHRISGEVKGSRAGDLVTFTPKVGATQSIRVAADGSFSGPPLSVGEVEVTLRDRAWVELETQAIVVDGAQWVSFDRSSKTCTLDVHVEDAGGSPLSDVVVELAGKQATRSEAAFARASHRAQTDMDGDAALADLSPGAAARLRVSLRGGQIDRRDVDPCGGSVSVVLSEGGEVRGTAPRKGESFEVDVDLGDERVGGRFTGGQWVLEGLPAGTHTVVLLSASGWSCSGPVAVTEGGVSPFDCEAKPSRIVRGSVRRSGRPVSGVTVSVGRVAIMTPEDGTFSLFVPETEARLTLFDSETLESRDFDLGVGEVDLGAVELSAAAPED